MALKCLQAPHVSALKAAGANDDQCALADAIVAGVQSSGRTVDMARLNWIELAKVVSDLSALRGMSLAQIVVAAPGIVTDILAAFGPA